MFDWDDAPRGGQVETGDDYHYSPLVGQAIGHRIRRRVLLATGGVGSGKTEFGAAEYLRRCTTNSPRTIGRREADSMIVAPTWTILRRTTLRKFRQHLPAAAVRKWVKGERYIELVNGHRCYYGSASDPESLDGPNLTHLWGDEARYYPPEAHKIILARVRIPAPTPGITYTTTPSMGWLFDLFGPLVSVWPDYPWSPYLSPSNPDLARVRLRTEDNPHIDPDFVERMRRQYTPAMFRAYAEGHFAHLEGSVYGPFVDLEGPRGTLIDFSPRRDLTVDMGWDFGLTPAVVFSQAREWGDVVFGELTPEGKTTEEVAVMARDWLKSRGLTPGLLSCDPAGQARNSQTMRRDVRILKDYFPHVWYARDNVRRGVKYGLDLVSSRFRDYTGERRLYVSREFYSGSQSNPRGVVSGLRGYRWDKRPGVDKPVKDGVVDHAMDALRYLVVGLHGSAEGAEVMTMDAYEDRQQRRSRGWD